MNDLLRYSAEVIICSGVFYLLYRLVLDGKISFKGCRLYLVGVLLLGALIPLLHIPVWPAEVVWLVSMEELSPTPIETTTGPAASFDPTIEEVICLFYLIGTLLMVAATLRQLLLIRTLRREAERTMVGHHPLYRTLRQITPFSFWGAIYIWKQTPEEAMPAIVAHELSHLRHRHTLERPIAEALKVVLWWNPFMWLTVRALTEVEEYEADRDVLNSGIEPSYYMTILFRQLFGISPDIVNGLPHSLTKKRFEMMTRKIKSSHNGLRATAVAATVAGLMCAFSLTAQATQYRTEELPEAQKKEAVKAEMEAIRVTTFTDTPQQQQQSAQSAPSEEEPFLVVENMPTFEGGDLRQFQAWISKQIRMPKDENGVQLSGMVIVEFIIERDGSLANINPLDSPDERLTAEVVRVLKHSPRWEAGTQRGEKVRVKHTLPIMFAKSSSDREGKEIEDAPAEPFYLVRTEPKFDGGDLNTFRRWVMQNVRYPKESADKQIGGRVVCSFTIDEQGRLIDPKIERTPDKALGDEVIRVLNNAPDKWICGEERGKPIAISITLPIDFTITQ